MNQTCQKEMMKRRSLIGLRSFLIHTETSRHFDPFQERKYET